MRKTLHRALTAAAACLLMAPAAGAQVRAIRIETFDVSLNVARDGVLRVTERLAINFVGSWNGIVREISRRHVTATGRTTKLDINDVRVTDMAGNPLRVEDESDSWTRKLRIWIPGADDAVRGIVISYRVSNAIRFFRAGSDAGELDELYWNATGNGWSMPIDRVAATVVLRGVAPRRSAAYTGAAGSPARDASIETVGDVVSFTTTRSLDPYEGMTVAVGWPAGHIGSRPSAAAQRIMDALRWWPLLFPPLVLWLALRAWRRRGRDPRANAIVVQYEPPHSLSPAELGTLVDHRAEMRDVTSTLVDLAVRGYIGIEERVEKKMLGLVSNTEYEFFLLRPRAEWDGLAGHERRYLNALFDGATTSDLPDRWARGRPRRVDSMSLERLQNVFYKSLPGIHDEIYDALASRGFYHHRPDKVRGNWIGVTVLVLALGMGGAALAASQSWTWVSLPGLVGAAMASAAIVFAVGLAMPARTEAGARAREAALGFREFLSRVESDRYRRMITSPEMFERYLPHAMAFGVEQKWARAFEDIYRDPPQWYSGPGTGTFHVSEFSSRMSEFSSTAGSAMSSSPSSSGSGGGGSSGGGSGGGGGSGF